MPIPLLSKWYITDGVLHRDEIIAPTKKSISLDFTPDTTALLIPYGVREIAPNTFCGCKKLISITVPSSVREIGFNAFNHCEQLKTVILGYGIEIIGDDAFSKTAVNMVCIPDTVKKLGRAAFADCEKLAGISLSRSLTEINEMTFIRTALKLIDIPSSVKKIKAGAFACCGEMESITLREGLEEIGIAAFYGHKNLIRLTFPDSLREIGALAFAAELTDSEKLLFTRLRKNHPEEPVTAPEVFRMNPGKTCALNPLSRIIFGSGLEVLGDCAFFGCHLLTDVKLPDGMLYNGPSALPPFYICDAMSLICP